MIKFKNLKVPTVAAVSGYCFGGGFEFALGCNGIVALNRKSTSMAFPEVKLGVLPGAGGCVKLFNKVYLINF